MKLEQLQSQRTYVDELQRKLAKMDGDSSARESYVKMVREARIKLDSMRQKFRQEHSIG